MTHLTPNASLVRFGKLPNRWKMALDIMDPNWQNRQSSVNTDKWTNLATEYYQQKSTAQTVDERIAASSIEEEFQEKAMYANGDENDFAKILTALDNLPFEVNMQGIFALTQSFVRLLRGNLDSMFVYKPSEDGWSRTEHKLSDD